jgi:hypothetical protein
MLLGYGGHICSKAILTVALLERSIGVRNIAITFRIMISLQQQSAQTQWSIEQMVTYWLINRMRLVSRRFSSLSLALP